MSGIAGFLHCSGEPADPQKLSAMTSLMKHRGPDGIGHWHSGAVALGHCMFHTTPESLSEAQPLINSAKNHVLVADGRIDNWEEVRALLEGAKCDLSTHCDAELISKSFETWGNACFERLDGDFAIALWDIRSQTLHIARDRSGQKPFFYHWNGQSFTFASELSAILAMPWVRQSLNEGMIAEILTDKYCSLEQTFWKDIYRLLPAHSAKVRVQKLTFHRYWTPGTTNEIRYRKHEDYVAHYRELLFDTVRRFSRSHKPLGCEVSGGLDSSAIFSVGANLAAEGKLLSPDLKGFTLSFPDDTDANELRYARAVSEHASRPVQEVPPTYESLNWHLRFAQVHKALPLAPNSLMHGGIQKAMAGEGCVVSLHGLGGDEWLSGSPNTYSEAIALKDWAALKESFLNDLANKGLLRSLYAMPRYGLLPLLPEPVKRPLRRFRDQEDTPSKIMLSTELAALLEEQVQARSNKPNTKLAGSRHKPQVAHLTNVYALFAREASEHFASLDGIEARAPLYSKPIIEFSLSTPAAHRMRSGMDRAIHRQALKGVLPESVRLRQSKAEFSSVYEHYLPALAGEQDWQSVLQARNWLADSSRAGRKHSSKTVPEPELNAFEIWAAFSCAALFTASQE